MPEPVFSRILLKLSGEVLANEHGFGIDPERVLYLAREIEPVYKSNVNIGLIIGAGIFFVVWKQVLVEWIESLEIIWVCLQQ